METIIALIVMTKLGAMLAKGYQLGKGVEQGIRFLKDELSSMYLALQKLEDKKDDQIDPLVIVWRDKVRELSYIIKDCIDRFTLNLSDGDSDANVVGEFVGKVTMWSQNRRIAEEIEELRILVKEQSDRAQRFRIHKYLAASPHPEVIQKQHVQSSIIGKLSAMHAVADEYQLPAQLKGDIRFLKDELSSMYVVVQKLEDIEDLQKKKKLEDKEDDQIEPHTHWRNEVRELSCNIEDRIDRFLLNHNHGGSNENIVHKVVRKVKIWQDRQTPAVEIRKFKDLVSELSERAADHCGIYESLSPSTIMLERIVDGSQEPSHLEYLLLVSITENFSEKQIIGQGGCGKVYKGVLRNGVAVAVKRFSTMFTIDDDMFHQEVKSLFVVRHRNIVRLLGYCSRTLEHVIIDEAGKPIMVNIRERLLCLDYFCNGSLDSHITDELRGLDWHKRYEIIVGICKGLSYLHNEKGIFHMDLKPANILLDDHLVPKITDFGISRLDNKSQPPTTALIGTLIYGDPEYLLEGKSSSKSDIYSLGVIITEVVTGSNKKVPDITKVLRRWRHRWIKSSNYTPLSYQQVTKCLELAQKCRQIDPEGRPDILHIIDELNQTMEDQIPVIPGSEDMLGIDPLEIHFSFDQELSHAIELTNDTEDFFAFITKTSLHRLSIEPEKGIVPPGSKCSVTVTMMQAQVNVAQINRYKEEITVLSTIVDGGLAAENITGDMFIDKEGKVVDEVNVLVVLEKPYSIGG